MDNQLKNSSTSGFIESDDVGVNNDFTDISILTISEVNFIARAKRAGRWWILKGLSEKVREREQYKLMLAKEYNILVQLSHPGVVYVYGLENVLDLGLCIIMESLEGVTLTEWLMQKHTPIAKNNLFKQLLDAIDYIHSKNIVHRDIKPDNIIITHNGTNLKVIDFGLADTDSYDILKQPGGTPKYMAPEQTDAFKTDIRNDIYSLGLILKEMGYKPKSAVGKCLKSIKYRFRSIGELKNFIEKKKKRKRLVCQAVLVLVLTTLSAGLLFMLLRKPHRETFNIIPKVNNIGELQNKIDSLTTIIEDQQSTNDSLMLSLSHHKKLQTATNQMLNSVSEELNKKKNDEERNSRLLNEAFELVKSRFYDMPFIQHLDTLTDGRYLKKNIAPYTDWKTFISNYVDEHFNELTKSERLKIESTIITFYTNLITPYVEKYTDFANQKTKHTIVERANLPNDRP